MNTISFFVPGSPKPQPRQKQRIIFPKGGGKPFATNYDPGDAEIWKREVRLVAVDYVPNPALFGPVYLDATFYFARPVSHYGTGKNAGKLKPDAPMYHTTKPDRDNLEKALLDCFKTIGMFRDDCLVCDGFVKKLYAEPGKTGCLITIMALENKTSGLAQRTIFAPEPAQPELMPGDIFSEAARLTRNKEELQREGLV